MHLNCERFVSLHATSSKRNEARTMHAQGVERIPLRRGKESLPSLLPERLHSRIEERIQIHLREVEGRISAERDADRR